MKYDYIMEFVCDHLCRFADENWGLVNQEKLDRRCKKCALVIYLKDLEENGDEK